MTDVWHTLTVQVPFASVEHARLAKETLQVDQELNPSSVRRTLKIDGNILVATFSTLTIRLARLTINSFLDNIELVIRTLGEFAYEAEEVNEST